MCRSADRISNVASHFSGWALGSSIWRNFIPFPAYQVFQRGGYFSVEVIPNSVAVISLNTMYFYDSNTGMSPHTSYVKSRILTSRHGDGAAVGGCEHSDPQDPGNLEFDWLEVQLQMFRERKMQVRPAFLAEEPPAD